MAEIIQANRLDSDETAFFARQLEFIKAQTYDKRYPELLARTLIPVSNEGGPGVESITYYQYDMFGAAKIVASYANDLPRADVRGKKFTASVHSLGDSYGYNIQEIRGARFAGIPLEQRKANAAVRAIEQGINTIAWFGEADHNIPGFLNNPNVPMSAVANTGKDVKGNPSTLWVNKSPNQILYDMNECANGIVSLTKKVERPNTLLLPVAQYLYIASTPRSDLSDTTILDFFLQNNPYIKDVVDLNELAYDPTIPGSGGPGGTDLMVAYNRDPDKLELRIPQDFEQFPPEQKGLEFEIACHARIGGVVMMYPLSASFAYGI